MKADKMVGIFTKQNNAYTTLKLLEVSENSSDPIFKDLQDFFLEQELNIRFTSVASKKHSSSRIMINNTSTIVPYLSLYVADNQSFKNMRVCEKDNNWSSSYSQTQLIIDKWSDLCKLHNLSTDYYSDNMLVFIYNLKKLQLISHVRRCKILIQDYFKSTSSKRKYLIMAQYAKPLHVLVSSQPAIRVFYKSVKQLNQETQNGNIEYHNKSIDQLLSKNDKHRCYEKESVVIEFLDCQTNNDKMYGFFRED
jgi:hypothetical protein